MMNIVGFCGVINHGNYTMTFCPVASAAIMNVVISC